MHLKIKLIVVSQGMLHWHDEVESVKYGGGRG